MREAFSITQKYLERGLSLRDLFGLKVRPSQIQPILIDLIQGLVDKKDAIELLRNYEKDRFSKPSLLAPRQLIGLSCIMYNQVPSSYTDIELSPVAPLGTNSVLTEVSQKSILSTVRGVEALADPTTMLALEIARKRREQAKGSSSSDFMIDLCTSVRCIRGQVFSDGSGFLPHFQLFAMSSGGISSSGQMDSKIMEHTKILLSFLRSVQICELGYSVAKINVDFSNINITESLIRMMHIDRRELGRHSQDSGFDFFRTYQIKLPNSVSALSELDERRIRMYGIRGHVDALQAISEGMEFITDQYPQAAFKYDLSRIAGIGYYNGPCFKISAVNSRNEAFPLADGGYSDWLAKLLSNKRVKFFSSGFGLELFGNLFKTPSFV